MRTIKQLQRFYVVEVFRPQPPTPGSQGSETVSPPCGASAFNRGQYTTRVTVRASKGRALQLEHGLDFLSIQAYALWMEYPSREKDEAAEDQVRASGQWRLVILLLAVIAALVLAKVFGLGERMGELRVWIERVGSCGRVVFALLYVAGVVAMLPGSALTLAAGALFGSVVGIAVVSVGATLGTSAAFLDSRYFARDAAANWLGKNEKFRHLDQLTEK